MNDIDSKLSKKERTKQRNKEWGIEHINKKRKYFFIFLNTLVHIFIVFVVFMIMDEKSISQSPYISLLTFLGFVLILELMYFQVMNKLIKVKGMTR